MIIYNLTIKIDNNIHSLWLDWMKKTYIPEMLATGIFHDYRLCRLLEQDDSEGPTYTAQFFCDSMENYTTFMQEHATDFYQKAKLLFGDKIVSFQTVMQPV
jgi:Domain of unknown function (DUF4286)